MFHRSKRLFLRPPFPEDREDVCRVLDQQSADAVIADGRPGRHFMVILPEEKGGPVIGLASIVDGHVGKAIRIRIMHHYRGEAYGAEAAAALAAIARACGIGVLPKVRFAPMPQLRETADQPPLAATGLRGEAMLSSPRNAA